MSDSETATLGSYITNCVLVAPPGHEPIFNDGGGIQVCLDHYAIIPLELFEEMGGGNHPAYRAWCERYFRDYYTVEVIAAMHQVTKERDEAAMRNGDSED